MIYDAVCCQNWIVYCQNWTAGRPDGRRPLPRRSAVALFALAALACGAAGGAGAFEVGPLVVHVRLAGAQAGAEEVRLRDVYVGQDLAHADRLRLGGAVDDLQDGQQGRDEDAPAAVDEIPAGPLGAELLLVGA